MFKKKVYATLLILSLAGCASTTENKQAYSEPENSSSSISFVRSSFIFKYEPDINPTKKKLLQEVFSNSGEYSIDIYRDNANCKTPMTVDVGSLENKALKVPSNEMVTILLSWQKGERSTGMVRCESLFSFNVEENTNYTVKHHLTNYCSVTVFNDTTGLAVDVYNREYAHRCDNDDSYPEPVKTFSVRTY
ncbi:hypothetical protein HC752_23475 [Vibrio sp. S9_S30]|uniref:hypothetical protein n=1 Tax=Vibrio sp. S9_S30 TaxID=2720226 RepID=UPI001681C1A0|nr:hypothetical protein [Vibrio sp. S9_S30]MBD1559889.1 hypothetical protein [Vibrio sp. S9_S30]